MAHENDHHPSGYHATESDVDATEKARLLTAAFEAIPEGFVIYDADDRMVLCNTAYRDLYRLSAPAMVPGTSFEAILRYGLARGQYPEAGATQEQHETWLLGRLQAHRGADRQIEQRLADGRWLHIHERRLETGHTIGFRSDITNLKQLDEDRSRFARVIERIQQEIYLIDVGTGRCMEVNDHACNALGYTRDELLGMTPADFNIEFEFEQVRALLAPLIAGETASLDFETRHRRRNGETYPCRVRAFYDAGIMDDADSIVAFVEDISERRKLELEVQQGREELETLLKGIPDLILCARPDTTLTFINSRFAEAHGTSVEDLIGRRLTDLLPPADKSSLESGLAQMTPEKPVFRSTQHLIDETGMERVYQWSHSMSFRDGAPHVLFSVGRDVNELHAVNSALAKANDELESFAYAASHDLRSPIQTMRSLLGVLEEDYLPEAPEDARMVFERLTGVADRMLQLSNGVLDYARVTGMPPEQDRFDVGDLLDGVLGNLEAEIAESGARVAVGPMPALSASRQQIGQVFQNLIANALKFRRPGTAPEIAIEASDSGTAHVFAVADRGIGIDKAEIPTIFQPFRRLHGQRSYVGSGLGLTICRRIVERHGGKILARAREGGGTIFEFSIRKNNDVQ